MNKNILECPACGAPLTLTDNETKMVCRYCGKTTLLDTKFEQSVGYKVATTIHESESKTQLGLQRLQLSQELSMLNMQLANLRSEKRMLERDQSLQGREHLRQVCVEEQNLSSRIAAVHAQLYPATQTPPPVQNSMTGQPYLYSESNKSWGMTLFLACTLGFYGVHRYYVGRIGSALIQTFTGGGFGLWWLIDIISILTNRFTDSKGRLLNHNIKANRIVMIIIGVCWLLFFIFYVIGATTEPSSGDSMSFAISTLSAVP